MILSDMDARVAYAVGAFLVDLSMLRNGVRTVAERFWKEGEVGCEKQGVDPQFSFDLEYEGTGDEESGLPSWSNDELSVFTAGVKHILAVEDEILQDGGWGLLKGYDDLATKEMRKRKLTIYTSGYDVKV